MTSIREIPQGLVTAPVLDLSKVWPDEKHRLHLQIKMGYHYDNGTYNMLNLGLISTTRKYSDIVMESLSEYKTEPVTFKVDMPSILLFRIDESHEKRVYEYRKKVEVELCYAKKIQLGMQKGLMIQTSVPEDFKIQKGKLGLPNILETYIYPRRNKEQKTLDDLYTLLRDKPGR